MALCFSYRYLMIVLTSLGNILSMCLRSAFPMIVTHTIRRNSSAPGPESFYHGCTSYNTRTDYISDYAQDHAMLFHTAFYFAVFFGTLLGGHVAIRFPSHRILGLGIFVSSVSFCVLPLVYQISFVGVLVIRFLQGFTDAITQPAIVMLVTSWAKRNEKSSFLSLALIGQFLSPAITNISVGAFLCYISWDSAFYFYGAAGILWSLLWAKLAFPLPQECPYLSKSEMVELPGVEANLKKGSKGLASNIPWKGILTCKAVWAVWFCSLCRATVSATILTLQPLFFQDIFGLRAADSGLILSLPFVVNTVGAFFFSFMADTLIASGRVRHIFVRKMMQCVGALFESLFLVLMIYATSWQMSFLFLLIAYAFDGMTFSGYKCNVLDLSVQFSAVVMAIVRTGSAGSFSITLVASLVTGKHGSFERWTIIFWMEAFVAALASTMFLLFAKGERQEWDGQAETAYEIIPNSNCECDEES